MKTNILIVLLCFFIINSCAINNNNKYTEGNYIFPNNLEKIKKGMNKKEVYEILGPKTLSASFNESIDYYIYEISQRKLKFLDKEIVDSMILILYYDKNNTLKDIIIKNINDRNNIPYDKSLYISTLDKHKLVDKKYQQIDTFK